jgi:S-DNA-T family DNA segregation ATPase FtsK/SpoIIIE
MINDLSPELAERALQALENELSRRQYTFDRVGKITDIWDFNRRYPEQALPHLLVVIDEFTEGIKILPNLVERLRDLGRRGRAFGMYFFLANQEVNSAVDSLKSNVGWYVVLKVKRAEEMNLVDKNLPIAPGKGRGYVRVKSDITGFQGAYGGLSVLNSHEADLNEYTIWTVREDGFREKLYEHRPQDDRNGKERSSIITEQEMLVSLMQETSNRIGIEPAKPIYIAPLPEALSLRDVFEESSLYRQFDLEKWTEASDINQRLITPIGYLDIPEECLQTPLMLDLNESDGNLWVVGNPGSGRPEVLKSILLSLAYTHRPDELQFYILEYGGGALKDVERLPHVGAVLRLAEKERLERLIKYLEEEFTRRSECNWRRDGLPEIVIVVNDFSELNREYPDQTEVIARFVRSGKDVGIHLIIATSRGGELNRKISSNIARRIVLHLATRDEYMDVIGRVVSPATEPIEGRGFWVGRGVFACQIAQPKLDIYPDLVSQGHTVDSLSSLVQKMDKVWTHNRPLPILTLPESIPFSEVVDNIQVNGNGSINAPIGIEYESIDWIYSNHNEELPNRLILGTRQSGKTNFLWSFANALCQANPDTFDVRFIALRRGPLTRLANNGCPFRILCTPEEIVEECESLMARSISDNRRPYVMLIDDLGGAFEPGREMIAKALDVLAVKLSSFSDVYLLAAGLREELQPQFSSAMVKILKQSRTGVVFSRDATDLDWLGAQVSLKTRKTRLPVGRGFFVSKGQDYIVQVPLIDFTN